MCAPSSVGENRLPWPKPALSLHCFLVHSTGLGVGSHDVGVGAMEEVSLRSIREMVRSGGLVIFLLPASTGRLKMPHDVQLAGASVGRTKANTLRYPDARLIDCAWWDGKEGSGAFIVKQYIHHEYTPRIQSLSWSA